MLPCQTRSALAPHSKALSMSVYFWGWRLANTKFESWARKMAHFYEPIWRKAGIFEAVVASTYKICKNTDLVLGIAEKWCPDTKTFVFPWGETTITLEDVMVLSGFSVLGSPVFAPPDSSGEKVKAKLEKEWLKVKKDNVINQQPWMERFMDSGDELEHVAFLALWLSYFVFPSPFYHLYKAIFPIAIHLLNGTRIALAPAVLAHLYAELSLLKTHIRAFRESTITKIDLTALFKLVQVWSWERFKELQPPPNPLLKGEPRLALWHYLKQFTSDVRQILDNLKMDSIEWRPYTKTVRKWEFPKFYPENAMWVPVGPNLDDEFISFARCMKVSVLVGIHCLEHYFPNRVGLQFGLLQDVPCLVRRNNLSQEAAWNDYNEPINVLALYIPSRTAIPCVTPKFSEWWRNVFPRFKSSEEEKLVVASAETSRETNIDDGNCFVPTGSKTKRTSEDGMKKVEDSINKRRKYMKQARENGNNVSAESLPRNNDPEPFQTLASRRDDGDETVPTPEIEKKNEQTEKTGSKAGKIVVSPTRTWQTCDDELHVYGSNAEKKNMSDDGSKEPDCLLHDDGTIVGEKASSDERLCSSEAEKEDADVDDDSLIQNKLATAELTLQADINEPSPRQKLALESANDESYIHIIAEDGTHVQDHLVHDNVIGSEETMKPHGQLEDLERRNDDFGEDDAGNDSFEKRFQELRVLASSLEEQIIKAQRDVAKLKETRVIKLRKIASARGSRCQMQVEYQ